MLYHSTAAAGGSTAVSGTIAIPPGTPPAGGWPVITWTHGTTGLAPVCAPSLDTPTGPEHPYLAGLRTLLVRLGREYPTLPPLYVTENGAAYDDVVAEDGRIHDVDRDAFIQDHIDQVELAIADGADNVAYRLSLNTLVAAQRSGAIDPDLYLAEREDQTAQRALAAAIAAGDAATAERVARALLERSVPQ